MVVINNTVYNRTSEGLIKCILHKTRVNGNETFYLKATEIKISRVPKEFEVMTLAEIVAKFGQDAIDDMAESEAREEK